MTTVYTATKSSAPLALLALTQQAIAVVTVGAAVDVSTKFAGRVFVKMGRTAVTALTAQVAFRIEASAKTSGNDEWYPIQTFTSVNGTTTANSSTLNGATTAPNATSVITSATGILPGGQLYFRETGTPANSEWSRVASMATTTITFEEPQTRNHANGIAITNLAEYFTFDFDLSGIVRLRIVVDTASNASGTTVDVIAWMTTLDSTLGT